MIFLSSLIGTVHVDELYGIYSFPQVHQMISTVSGELRENYSFSDIIHATFPMGSMTGAPKRRVMELIEKYEKTKRGVFSGAFASSRVLSPWHSYCRFWLRGSDVSWLS